MFCSSTPIFPWRSGPAAWAAKKKEESLISRKVDAPDTKYNDKLLSRYMEEIRDIAKAGLNRRELLRMGLVMGGAGAAALQGVRGFKPYWAHAGNSLQFHSPRNTP